VSLVVVWRDVTTEHVEAPPVGDQRERHEGQLQQRHLHQIIHLMLCNCKSHVATVCKLTEEVRGLRFLHPDPPLSPQGSDLLKPFLKSILVYTNYNWSPRSPKLEGKRPTGLIAHSVVAPTKLRPHGAIKKSLYYYYYYFFSPPAQSL